MTFLQATVVAVFARPVTLLAQGQAGLASRILLWGLALVALIVIAGVGLLWFRRRLAQGRGPAPATFSMEALEAMRTSGELSAEEFRRLRRAALPLDIAAMTRRRDRDANCTLSPPVDGDDEDSELRAARPV